MANNPKKALDATEAAMAAIQEALNVRDAEMKASASKPAPEPQKPEPRKPAAKAAPSPARDQVRDPAPAEAPTPASAVTVEPEKTAAAVAAKPEPDTLIPELGADVEPGRPANDDWKSIGQILQQSRNPSSRLLYIGAAIGSAVWVVLALFLMVPFLSLMQQYFAPVLLALMVTFLAPPAFFFAVAIGIPPGKRRAIGPTAGIGTAVSGTFVRGRGRGQRNLPRLPRSRGLPPGEPANPAGPAQPVNSGAGGGR